MSSFRTVMPKKVSEVTLSHQDRTLCIGSCFAEHIGDRLTELKFPVLINPFGIVYNPVSVADTIDRILSNNPFGADELHEQSGLWHSFAHHGRFSHPDREKVLNDINSALESANQFIGKTTRLIVTLGTAYAFVRKSSGKVVANCHKMPGNLFERRRLTVEEITNALTSTFQRLKETNETLKIIVTVSPVRHLRDGLVQNQRSKATLVLALEQLCQRHSHIHYFPSYEILLDDLRDYRFYETDLAHPTQMAVNYIWEYFEHAFLQDKTIQICRRLEKLNAARKHRPFHPDSEAHQNFIRNQLEAIRDLNREYPVLDLESEKKYFEGSVQ